MPRPRKPTHLKLVSGTFRPDRSNPEAPKSDLVLLEAPAWLNPDAKAIFDELAQILFDLGVSERCDGDMLGLLSSRLDEIRVCTGIIEDLGRVYAVETATGCKLYKRRPEVAMRADAMRHAQSLLNEFGLSPASRSKVSRIGAKGDSNPFMAL